MSDPPDLPIEVHFSYERGDYAEAMRAISAGVSRGTGFGMILVGFLMFVGGAMLGIVLRPRAAGEAPLNAGEVLCPLVVFAALISLWFMMVRGRRSRGARVGGSEIPKTPVRVIDLLIGLAIALAAGAGAFIANYFSPASPPADQYPRAQHPFATVGGWILAFVMLAALFFRFVQLTRAKGWEAQPWLHRPKRLRIDGDALTISDDVTDLRYAWPAFVAWDETANLFVARLSHLGFIMIPKRAFTGDVQRNALRNLLADRISVARG